MLDHLIKRKVYENKENDHQRKNGSSFKNSPNQNNKEMYEDQSGEFVY